MSWVSDKTDGGNEDTVTSMETLQKLSDSSPFNRKFKTCPEPFDSAQDKLCRRIKYLESKLAFSQSHMVTSADKLLSLGDSVETAGELASI
jgi:hypothetical protein